MKRHLSIIPGGGLGVTVVNNDLEFALRLFKKNIKDSGKLLEVKANSYYTKPSVTRRFAKKRAVHHQKRQSAAENNI